MKFELNTYRHYPYAKVKLPKLKGNIYTFYAPTVMEMYGEGTLVLPLDIHVELDENEVLIIMPNDTLAIDHNIVLANTLEIIDGAVQDGKERNIILHFLKRSSGYSRINQDCEIAKGIVIKYTKKRGK